MAGLSLRLWETPESPRAGATTPMCPTSAHFAFPPPSYTAPQRLILVEVTFPREAGLDAPISKKGNEHKAGNQVRGTRRHHLFVSQGRPTSAVNAARLRCLRTARRPPGSASPSKPTAGCACGPAGAHFQSRCMCELKSEGLRLRTTALP